MILCYYKCGREGKFKLKNGNMCCEKIIRIKDNNILEISE